MSTSLLPGCAGGKTTKRKYLEASSLNNVNAYKNFLDEYPDSEYQLDARKKLRNLEWKKIRSIHTIPGDETFITAYPNHWGAGQATQYINVIKTLKKRDEREAIAVQIKWYDGLSDEVIKSKNLIINDIVNKAEIYNFSEMNEQDKNGKTALMRALRGGKYFSKEDTELAQALIDNGADLNIQDRYGKTALIYALENGHTHIERALFFNLEHRDRSTASVLTQAIKNIKLAQALIDKGADLKKKDRDGKTALMLALEKGHIQIVRAFNKESETDLLSALEKENITIIKTLFDKEPNLKGLDNWGWSVLMWSAMGGQTDSVITLIEKGFDLNKKYNWNMTPLIVAAMNGHLDTVKALIDKGANLNAQDKWGWSPVMWAARNGHASTVKILLNKGANPKLKGKNGITLENIKIGPKASTSLFQTEAFMKVFKGNFSRPLDGFNRGEDAGEMKHVGINSVTHFYVKASNRHCKFKTVNKAIEKRKIDIDVYDEFNRITHTRPGGRDYIIDKAMVPLYNAFKIPRSIARMRGENQVIDKRIAYDDANRLFQFSACRSSNIRQFQRNLIRFFEMQEIR